MYYLDKRDNGGLLLGYSAYEMAHRISTHCFEKTKETEIYKILKLAFENDYLEIYFKTLYFEDAIFIAHKIVINDWEKQNISNHNLHKINIKSFLVEKYLQDFLVLNDIKFQNTIDVTIIKKQFLKITRDIKFYLKKKIIKLLGKKKTIENFNEAIGVAFGEGLNIDKRSDLFWLKNSRIKPENVILYFDYHHSINKHYEKKQDILNSIKKYNIRTIHLWEWNDNSKVDFVEELNIKLKELNVYKTEEKVLKQISLVLIKRVQFWYLFFKKLNIKIHLESFEQGTENIVKQLSLHKLDGCSVGKLRSHIGSKKRYDIIGFYPNDIFFIPSKDAGIRLASHSFFKFRHLIIGGFPYNLFTNNNKIELNKIKKFFHDNNKKFIVLLIDGSHSRNETFSENQLITTDSLSKFYNTLFDKLSEVDDIGIIIKTKKLDSFKGLKGIYNRTIDLEKKGICYFVKDPLGRGPSLYATIANLVIATGTFYPSALIDSICKKKLGVYFDIANLKSIEEEWYQWGNKKVIFNDMDELTKKIIEHKNNKMSDIYFGDWSNQKDISDPYEDNLGSERIGRYLNTLLEGFKNKLSSFESISMANYEFSKSWGKDKIIK